MGLTMILVRRRERASAHFRPLAMADQDNPGDIVTPGRCRPAGARCFRSPRVPGSAVSNRARDAPRLQRARDPWDAESDTAATTLRRGKDKAPQGFAPQGSGKATGGIRTHDLCFTKAPL